MDNGMDDFGDGDEAMESDEDIDTKKQCEHCDGAYLLPRLTHFSS